MAQSVEHTKSALALMVEGSNPAQVNFLVQPDNVGDVGFENTLHMCVRGGHVKC